MVAARAFSSGVSSGSMSSAGVSLASSAGCHRSRSRRQEHRQRLGRWQILLRWEHRPVRQGRIRLRLDRQTSQMPRAYLRGHPQVQLLPPGRRQAAAEWGHPALRSPGQRGSPPVRRVRAARGYRMPCQVRQPGPSQPQEQPSRRAWGHWQPVPFCGCVCGASGWVLPPNPRQPRCSSLLPWFLPLF